MNRGAILFKSDGTVSEVYPANGEDFQLDELKGFVGGWIEIVNITRKVIMVVNEEGKGEKLPLNGMATVIAKAENAIYPWDFIAGDALMCPSDMVK